MRQNTDEAIFLSAKHDWLKWSLDKYGTHDLLSWLRSL